MIITAPVALTRVPYDNSFNIVIPVTVVGIAVTTGTVVGIMGVVVNLLAVKGREILHYAS
jgi:hypothetical protein